MNNSYIVSKEIVGRKNQDNTVIIMKLDDSKVFYKINGLAALIWSFFQSPASEAMVVQAFHKKYAISTNDFHSEISLFIQSLLAKNLLVISHEPIPPTKVADIDSAISLVSSEEFGSIKEFDLEQIENEVLNQSIYLDVFAGSDLRIKKDVSTIQNALVKIQNLDGIHFRWDDTVNSHISKPSGQQSGLVAQQVFEHMPELIQKDTATGYMAVNYTKIIPYLVESIKELKAHCDKQSEEIEKLKNNIPSSISNANIN